jgi:hypothetical protein
VKNEITVMVESKKVPSRIVQFKFGPPFPGQLLSMGGITKSALIYDYELDAGQIRVLNEARRLARASGACLRIVDLARESGIRRAIRRIIRGGSGVPLLTIAGPYAGQLLSTNPGQAVSP